MNKYLLNFFLYKIFYKILKFYGANITFIQSIQANCVQLHSMPCFMYSLIS